MRRGDIVIVSAPGDYGKPRPAVVVQSDRSADLLESRTVCLMTSELVDAHAFRLTVEPTAENGLMVTTQVQVDKVLTFPIGKVGRAIGRLTSEQMEEIGSRLIVHFDIRGFQQD